MTYSCETTDKGTAEITGIVADDSVTAVSVPSSIEHGGQTYKVTKLYFSSGIVAKNVEQLTLPDTLEKMYGGNFRRFAKVKELHIPGSIKNFACSLQNAGSLEKLYFDEGVEEISANMMVYGCSNLSEIDLPSTLKMISGSGAFEGATALTGIEFPKDVAFSDTITGVFEDCTSLTSVSLPASVTKIPSHMFDGCTSLTSVTALSEIESIGDGAFRTCSSLTGIDFPGTLKSIGSSAFQGCASLVSVPNLSKVTKMGWGAFYECKNLQASVDLSSLQNIPDNAFCYTPVKIVGLCDSLKSIGEWAFIQSNVAVQLPRTLETIGNYAFYYGTLPEQLSIPDSVTSVGTAAFSGVGGVKDVTIGRGLTEIPSGMFEGSTVKKITIENSMDDIKGSENLPFFGVDIVYTRESIDDGVGGTVSDDSTKTLQDLVDEAPYDKETVITLKKHVKLGSTLTIPAGKMIKITSDEPYTILAKKSGFSVLVNVAEGASLELSGKVSLSGRYNKGAIISSRGAVVLSDEAVVCDGAANTVNTGVIDVSGDKASLTMTGGVIEQCELKDAYCGAVHAKDGAHVVMKGGVIRKNHVSFSADGDGNYLSSTGIMLMGDAHLEMSNGSIEDNAGYQGGAVVMYSEARNQRTSFEMTGGQLVRNRGYKLGNRTPSGAVHVEGNAEFTLKGGKIEDNIAYSDGKGGGVCVVDRGLQQGGRDHTAFTMKGGSVSGNSASAGGGIYTYSDDVKLSAGEIKDNTARNMGGGVYSEGNEYLVYSTLHIENALVVDNHAKKQGGGMWFCPTGDAKVYVKNGGLIARNSADEAGDDLVFTGFKDAKYKLTLANRAPGGGKVSWYRDGGLFNPEGTYAETNTEIPRFSPDGGNGEPLSFTDATPNVALKSVMSEDVYNLGRGQTSLTISGNTAERGGGIGANGGVIIGKSENIDIPIKKVWENPRIPHPNKVKVNLKNGDTVIDSITLSESNDWKGVFSNLPAGAHYTVSEDPVEGYSSEVTGDAERGFTVTNTSTAKVSVPVEKKWVGPAAERATVRLLADGKDAGESAELSKSNSWKHSFEGLPKYSESGSAIDYAVAEVPVEGYSSKVTGDAERGFTVTNTSTAKVSVPVEKKWVGPAAERATVRLLADGKDAGQSAELSKSNSWKHSFEGLPKYSESGSAIDYAVAEVPVEGYSSKVTGDAERGFTVTNTVKTGGLDVSKTVVAREGLAVDADKTFKFAVEATDAAGRKVSGTYGDATFEDGKATLKLKDGQTARITGLPAGTAYTVTERAAEGYTTAVNGAEGSRADGSISADQVASAAFTNTFDPAPATASVPELTKVLAGGRKPGLQEGEFVFELSLTDGAGNVLEGYPIEAKNDKDGKVSFGELSFTNLGTYHATVTEKASGDVLIEDDAHAYTFDITVTQTGAGLKAEISNERGKKTFTNTFTPHDNTKTVTKADASGAKVDVDGRLVGVGDTLTYTIGWANNSVDDRGAAQAADVTVTDVLPKGVNYVEGSADGAAYDAATRTLTWSLGEQTAGATGTLSFDVKVSAEAAVVDDISNTATVKVGENESQTNTTHNSVSREGSLTVKKTVVGGDSQREFGFTVALTDGDGEPVSGTFGKGEHAVTFADGKANFTLKDGGEKIISGLPVGAHYTVTEDAAEGYATTAEGAEGTVTEAGATAAFTNTYGTATEGRDVSTAGLFTKTLEGRDWAEGDSFQFTLAGEGGAPMPEGSADGSKTVSVTAAAGTKVGDRVAFDFGPIRYTLDDIKDAGFAEVGGKRVRAKTFTYTVREVRPDDGSAIAGVAYDGHAATMTVTVTDDGSGNLTATTPAIAQASGGDFVNTYTTKLDYSARAGVRLSKTLSGRAMEAGQFAFTVTADAETAAKLGLKTGRDAYTVSAADDGEADLMDIIGGTAGSDVKFTDADAGKTYRFTVTETKLGGKGYANDTAPRTVTIAPAYDAATGKLTVTTTVAKDGVEVARSEVSTADDAAATPAPVTVAFQNSYEATGTLGGEGNVAINATKTLTGRAAAAGEFSFSVRDARGDVVATATNRASGDGEAAGLAFSPIAYTTGALGQMVADGTATRAADGSWAIPYTVSEDGTDRLPAGVTAATSSFGITVKVTDDGKGGLDVAVVYPEGSDGTLSFVNGYSAGEATVDIAGTKTLALGQAGLGLTQGDIAGRYTFKIEPLDGAPAPVDASGKTVTEATNDAAGNVELGHVTFKQPSDLDDVEIDGDGLRTKTFAYRVSESGSVDGVANDATATRTFTVSVVEDTNAGTLVAGVLPAEGTPEGKGAFEFTNTYGVNPTPSSVTDQIKVSKKLKGRDLVEGEFEFQLVEIAADGSESVAATGKNATDGTVALSPVAYTAPGMHSYELREVAGTAGGVTYDKATYRVRTTVTDAGNGTLTVKHELADAEGNPTGDTSVTFTNGYEAAPVTLKLGAAKVLKGAELKADQFSFELKSRDGKVMSTAKNAADGSVTFDALTFKQAGTYTFTVSEVDDGQAHVTYDKAVRKIVVTVGDEAADGTRTGYLSAKVSYEGDANLPPVFTNSYAEEPGTPGTPENPGTPGGGSGGGSDNGSGSGSSGDGSKGGMPDTGDRSLPIEALAAMAGIGALTAAGGAVLYRRRR
ncbi:Cna B-type domain-containing protein [Collinsella sp. AF23-6]|uniref:Spy0128 family protein n=1 Tax=Collinsella sp. AF23-6 TaxID=2292225 RepID=UPI000E466820|nr:FctA domain-containing protein [Collinsella sp. AF23-6]RGS20672.1 Cna B-type domain-containing protein [Collinsella sp. AF23-6]